MEKEIENLIEELTKVRPEMLNEEALKLFNTIMAILDERDRLRETNIKQAEIIATANIAIKDLQEKLKEYVPISKIEEKIDFIKSLNEKIYYEENVISILEELMEDK